ncbi:MAG: hypothetical protein ACWGOX_15235 [Desulforhopalus sp.]
MARNDRLDVMIYGHDGRGLGHASRGVAIGMALRRLYPELKILFVSGCNITRDLIGAAPLDWLKLPSYATRVIGGRSRGVTGKSMFEDRQLGEFRAKELAHLVALYRPRLVLVDHTPQGKHQELVAALSVSGNTDTRWVLGIRGVVGAVKQAGSMVAQELYRQYYQALLWYGDSGVLGNSHLALLEKQYGSVPQECGYVSRLAEVAAWSNGEQGHQKRLAGTISVPWLGEKSMDFLVQLAEALKKIPAGLGPWKLFVGSDNSPVPHPRITALFGPLSHCCLEPPGAGYGPSLLRSKSAVIYGGYNSLMDVLHARIPSLVALREMQDDEQQIHLQRLQEAAGAYLSFFNESEATAAMLERLLLQNLRCTGLPPLLINMAGAPNAAKYLASLL